MAIQTKYPSIRPSLDLNFAGSQTVDPRITFSRPGTGNVASYFDSKGAMRFAPPNTPRIDFDPVTGECKGLLIEAQRTRLNLVAAAPTVAESITVATVGYTVSFYGTGSIMLSNAHTATVTGAGAFPSRTTLTFTPAAGTLTITPSGIVQNLQLEAGAFATSVIAGEGSQITRAADSASMTGTNFSDWYRQDEGTVVSNYSCFSAQVNNCAWGLSDGTSSNNLVELLLNSAASGILASIAGIRQLTLSFPSEDFSNVLTSVGYSFNNTGAAQYGVLSPIDVDFTPPSVNRLAIGRSGYFSDNFCGHIKRLAYYPKRLTNEQLQALTV